MALVAIGRIDVHTNKGTRAKARVLCLNVDGRCD